MDNEIGPSAVKNAEEEALPTSEASTEKAEKRPATSSEAPTGAPLPKKKLKFEDTYLRSIPRASQYEKSFMHRDVITHVLATGRDFVVTASQDGHLKFWKKKHGQGIEFVKHFRCHLKEFSCVAVNHNGTLMATCSRFDQSVKVFDVVNFDMINMLKLDFFPRVVCWVHRDSDLDNSLAISDTNSPKITVVDGKGAANEPLSVLEKLHTKPVILMEYCAALNVTISVDEMGMIEYWSGTKTNYEFPKNVAWEFKTDTDLYEFLKQKQVPKCLTISPDGKTFTIISSDRFIYVFDLRLAKISKKLDESLSRYIHLGKETKGFGIPSMEWNRRVALEKEMNRDPNAFRFVKVIYDESSNFIIYPTPVGISVFNMVTNEVVREIGKGENVRFLGVALCRAVPSLTEKLEGAPTSADIEAADNPNLKISEPDPMLIACAYRRNRFYIFTNVEPYALEEDGENGSSRDVFNEKPTKEDIITSVEDDAPKTKLCDQAVIHTTFGDIHVELYPDKCPKTVENFCTHSRRGYYNGHTFHRVIKSFMIQTGDPTGKGTGGQSIWGDDFEDEFHPTLRHDKPFRLSMANAGPNTNGSQFFITVVPAEWLDGKNTLFGQVTEGFNVVQKINQTPTYERSGRPRQEISIISISLKGGSK